MADTTAPSQVYCYTCLTWRPREGATWTKANNVMGRGWCCADATCRKQRRLAA